MFANLSWFVNQFFFVNVKLQFILVYEERATHMKPIQKLTGTGVFHTHPEGTVQKIPI